MTNIYSDGSVISFLERAQHRDIRLSFNSHHNARQSKQVTERIIGPLLRRYSENERKGEKLDLHCQATSREPLIISLQMWFGSK